VSSGTENQARDPFLNRHACDLLITTQVRLLPDDSHLIEGRRHKPLVATYCDHLNVSGFEKFVRIAKIIGPQIVGGGPLAVPHESSRHGLSCWTITQAADSEQAAVCTKCDRPHYQPASLQSHDLLSALYFPDLTKSGAVISISINHNQGEILSVRT